MSSAFDEMDGARLRVEVTAGLAVEDEVEVPWSEGRVEEEDDG